MPAVTIRASLPLSLTTLTRHCTPSMTCDHDVPARSVTCEGGRESAVLEIVLQRYLLVDACERLPGDVHGWQRARGRDLAAMRLCACAARPRWPYWRARAKVRVGARGNGGAGGYGRCRNACRAHTAH